MSAQNRRRAGTRTEAEKNTGRRRRIANLRPPWGPGESGNLAGRPKGSGALSKALRELLASPKPKDARGRTWAEVIADALLKKAARGNVAAIREAGDRTEGRPFQAVELTGRDGTDLVPAELPEKVVKIIELLARHRELELKANSSHASDSRPASSPN